MGNLFWNAEEKRMRMFWRILLHAVLMIVLVGAANLALLSAAFIVIGAENISLEDLGTGSLTEGNAILLNLSSVLTLLGITVATWLAARRFDRRRFANLGLRFNRQWWLDLLFGLALGAVLMLGIFLFELAAGWVQISGTFASGQESFVSGILTAAILFLSVGIHEELLSRGYHLKNFAEGFNHPRLGRRGALLLAYLVSSSIFGLLHFLNPNSSLVSTVNLIAAGLFLGLGYVLTRELAIPIGLHITWNFFQGNVFGFPVSGMAAGTTFIQIQQAGPDLWTGGQFGPEAGLLGLLAMAAGALLTAAWVRLTRGEARLQTELAVYEDKPTGSSFDSPDLT